MLNVRSKPTTKSSIIGKLKLKQEVKVFSIVNLWAEISYKNRKAYVSSKYLRKIEVSNEETENDEVKPEFPISSVVPKEEIIQEVIPNISQTSSKVSVYFLPTLYGGMVNLVSDKASPKRQYWWRC